MIRSQSITANEHRGYPLLDYDGPGAGYFTAILDRLIERFEYQLEAFSKVLVVRLVVKYPKQIAAMTSNHCFQYFIEEYRRKLAMHGFSPHYVWVRELHGSHNPHYHLILFLDGNTIPYFKKMNEANHLWQKALRRFHPEACTLPPLLIFKCPARYCGVPMNHGINVSRNNRPIRLETLRICSYIAKINTKGSSPLDCNDFHASKLPQQME